MGGRGGETFGARTRASEHPERSHHLQRECHHMPASSRTRTAGARGASLGGEIPLMFNRINMEKGKMDRNKTHS